MKRKAAVMTVVCLFFLFAACGNKNQNQSEGTSGQENQSQGTNQDSQNQQDNQAGQDTQEPEYGENVTLDTVKQEVQELLGENYWPNSEIPAEVLESTYGISQDMYEEYLGEMPMISTNVDTMIIIKAKEGQTEAVEQALNNYRDNAISNSVQYPMNVGKVQASRIEIFGNYVCFVQLGGDITSVEESGDEAIIAWCQEENERALTAISNALTSE